MNIAKKILMARRRLASVSSGVEQAKLGLDAVEQAARKIAAVVDDLKKLEEQFTGRVDLVSVEVETGNFLIDPKTGKKTKLK